METIIFVGLFLGLAWLLSRASGTVKFPGVIAVVAFGILYAWNQWGVLKFNYPFEVRHVIYLLVTLLIFGLTALAGMCTVHHKKHTVTTPNMDKRLALATKWLMVIGIMGGVLWALDIVQSQGGVSVVLGSNLNEIRDRFLTRTTGPMGQVGSVLYGCSLPGLLLGLRQWLSGSKQAPSRYLTPLLLCLILVMSSVAVLSGGRQSILIILLCISAVILYGGWRSFSKRRRQIFVAIGIVAMLLGTVYFLVVANQRTVKGNLTEKYLLYLWNSKLTDWYENDVQPSIPPALSDLIVTAHGYFPYNLTVLAVWIDNVDESSLGWGRLQGQHIVRQLQKLGVDVNYSPAINAPFDFVNPITWPTVIGSQIADFGLLGALFVTGGMGWLVGIAFGGCIFQGSFQGFLFTSIGMVYILYGVMSSPFQDTLLLYGLIWSLLASKWIVSRIRFVWLKGNHLKSVPINEQ